MEIRPLSEAILRSRVSPAPLTFLYPILSLQPVRQWRHRTRRHYLSTTPCSSKAVRVANSSKDTKSEPSFLSNAPNSHIAQLYKNSTPRPGQKSSADLIEESYASRLRSSRPAQGSLFAQTIDAAEQEKEKDQDQTPAPASPPAKTDIEHRIGSRSYQPKYKMASYPLSRYGLPLEPASSSVRTMKSSPMVGRSFSVRKGDVGTALKYLNILCLNENIKKDARTQKFYERPGAMRKRLRRVRHKARFKHGFSATVERIKEMRRKGW